MFSRVVTRAKHVLRTAHCQPVYIDYASVSPLQLALSGNAQANYWSRGSKYDPSMFNDAMQPDPSDFVGVSRYAQFIAHGLGHKPEVKPVVKPEVKPEVKTEVKAETE